MLIQFSYHMDSALITELLGILIGLDVPLNFWETSWGVMNLSCFIRIF